jgi:glyoxylase-like metal-dependent hydrolase (beta-lactamase superfamily II)
MTRQKKGSPANAKDKIIVRMYRALGAQGREYAGYLGDCFLIRVLNGDEPPAHILIDFGILMGSAQAEERMRQIATDIVKTTGGTFAADGSVVKKGSLDLLVITHEHWDHISGFSQAQDIIFEGLDIKKLWMAWTEDDDDVDARRLREDRDKRGIALAALSETIQRAAASPNPSPFAADRQVAFSGLDAFLGPLVVHSGGEPANTALAATQVKAKRLKGREIMEKVKVAALSTEFLSPGQVVDAPGAMKAFVLGPPRKWDRLKKDKPSSGAARETYFENRAFEDLLFHLVDGEPHDPDNDLPFTTRSNRIRTEKVRASGNALGVIDACTDNGVLRWLNQHYCAETDRDGRDQSRRTIDSDWLGAADQFAMQLDSDTNNTSLVLAFELPDETFMLFPGDAQVGNWLSWHDQDYQDGTRKFSATQILGRVRFYKVGHHGSHNATIKEKGLDLMTHRELVAAIPTDEAFGKQQGAKGWQMPNSLLKEAILAATKGRTFRNDDALNAAYTSFKQSLSSTNLYLEYTVI